MPHHDSFERKLAHARLLRDEIGIRRPVLVDDLAGTVHRAFGETPNMTWVFDRGGRVVYKANWTSAANVEAFLRRYLAARDDRPPNSRGGMEQARYETEQAEFRPVDRARFKAHLARNGPRAVREFDNARAWWAQHPRS